MWTVVLSALLFSAGGLVHGQDNARWEPATPFGGFFKKPGDKMKLTCLLDSRAHFLIHKQLRFVHKSFKTHQTTNISEQGALLVNLENQEHYKLGFRIAPTISASLDITVTDDMDGEFICEVKTHYDETILESISVLVTVAGGVQTLDIKVGKDKMVSTNEDIPLEFSEGKIEVECTATGTNPQPLIHLYLGGQTLQPKEDIVIIDDPDSPLTRRSFKGIAKYVIDFKTSMSGKKLKCYAETDIPEEHKSTITLDDRTVSALLKGITDPDMSTHAAPDPPTNVRLISCYSDQARIRWSFNDSQLNFSPPKNFTVEYSTSFSDEWVVGAQSPADSRQTEVELSLWAIYRFRVRAVNAIGVGKPSKVTDTCKTPMGRPDRHPRKVKTVGNKPGFLVIEWETMQQIEHNAPDLIYNITVKAIDDDTFLNFVERDYTVGRKEINVNAIYKPYEVTVRAQNIIGRPFIKANSIIGYSGEDAAPDPPTYVHFISCYSDQARIRWSFNDSQLNFSPLKNFTVEYSTSFSDEWVVGAQSPADSRQTEVELSLWAIYRFRVRAVNAIGVGKPSKVTDTCETPMGRPDRHPRKVKTVGNKPGFLVIEWETMQQIEHNAPDLIYNITVKAIDDDTVMNFVERDYTVGRKEINVNAIYKPYEVTVRAQNYVGRPFIKAKSIIRYSGEDVPSVIPMNFELDPSKTVTATSAEFSWDPVDTSLDAMQGQFHGYKIRFWKAGQKETTMQEVHISQGMGDDPSAKEKVTAHVRNLPSNSQIKADVVSVNTYFSSSGSNIVSFVTPERGPRPPSVHNITGNVVYFTENGRVNFDCVAEGTPRPEYYWLKNGLKFNIDERRMTLHTENGSLTIPSAGEADEGYYQCVATNIYGKSVSDKHRVVFAGRTVAHGEKQRRHSAMVGRSVVLRCNAPFSRSPVEHYWESGEGDIEKEPALTFTPLEMDDRKTMNRDGSLYITNLQSSDYGTYRCVNKNAVLGCTSVSVVAVVFPFGVRRGQPISPLWYFPSGTIFLLHSNLTFKCIFAGLSQPTIAWRRIGGKLNETRMKKSEDSFEFTITNIKYEDEGKYECAGRNNISTIRKTFRLTVQSKPQWIAEPHDTNVDEGDNAVFTCAATGRPEPSVRWFINGNPIDTEPANPRRRVIGNKLEITNLLRSDTQIIQCNATNKHGYLWSDVFLHVQAFPPKIEGDKVEPVKVARGQTAILTCRVSGMPKPTVNWFKKESLVSTGGRLQIQDNASLVIENVKNSDRGHFTCIAMNKFGQAKARRVLRVRAKTTISEVPLDLQVTHGMDATFYCKAVTDRHEVLEFVWLYNGNVIDKSDPQVEMFLGNLTIKNVTVQNKGSYTCKATNSLDSATASAKLEVLSAPDPPSNIRLISCYSDKALIRWSFDDSQLNFSPIKNFTVEYSTSFSDEWVVGAQSPADSRQTEVELSLWVIYRFRVRGVNAIGVGRPSKVTDTCRTPQGRPDRHPRKVKTVGNKPGFLVIEWETMQQIEHNAPGLIYTITVKAIDDDTVMNFIRLDYTFGRQEILVDTVYKPYEVTVRAQNSVGQPNIKANSIIGYSGEDVPSVIPMNFELDPTKTVTATSAEFRWDPVDTSPDAMQGVFHGYKIRFWKVGQKETSMQEMHISQGMGDNPSAHVRSLPANSQIEADVVSVNTYFSSSGSNIVSFTTAGVLSSVPYLEALYRGSSHFLLSWGEAKEPNGIITGYRVDYRMINGLDLGDLDVGEVIQKRRMFLGGLKAGQLYRVSVSAFTKIGQGQVYYIDLLTAGTSEEMALPVIKNVTDVTSSNVTITWLPSENNTVRVGARYFLEYRQEGQTRWNRNGEVETEHFWQQIEGLEYSTSYVVRVVSTSGKPGTAAYADAKSTPVTITTKACQVRNLEDTVCFLKSKVKELEEEQRTLKEALEDERKARMKLEEFVHQALARQFQ